METDERAVASLCVVAGDRVRMLAGRSLRAVSSIVMNADDAPRAPIWVSIILIIAAAAPYVQTLGFDFVNFDDNAYLTDNQIVQAGLTWKGVQYAFSTFDTGNWHPLTWLSHMADVTIWGFWAGGHHLTNLLIHVANTLLLFAVFRLMTTAVWRSMLVAILFAVHPLHVESVAWIAERKDVLSTFFGLLAMLAYARYVRTPSLQRYMMIVLPFAVSLLCKPMMVTLPCVYLLLDFWPLKRLTIGATSTGRVAYSRLILEKIPLLMCSIAISAIAVFSQHSAKAMSSLEAFSLSTRAANALVSYAMYLQKLFVPINLAVFYPHPGTWGQSEVMYSSVILVVISVLVLSLWRSRPWLTVGWLLFLGMLVPVIGLVQVGMQSMADRYMYFPAVGIFIMIAWSIPNPQDMFGRASVTALTSLCVLALAITATVQASCWKDSRALFLQAIAVNPNNFMAHQNLGNDLEVKGEIAKAMEHYQRAAKLRPNYGKIHENIANIYIKAQRYDAAMKELDLAVQLDPDSYSAHNSRGVVHLSQLRFADAELELRRSVDLDPNNLQARGNFGLALLKVGKYEEAIRNLSMVKEVHPERLGVRLNLALALSGSGRKSEAVVELQEILRAKPDFAPARAALAEIEQAGSSPAP